MAAPITLKFLNRSASSNSAPPGRQPNCRIKRVAELSSPPYLLCYISGPCHVHDIDYDMDCDMESDMESDMDSDMNCDKVCDMDCDMVIQSNCNLYRKTLYLFIYLKYEVIVDCFLFLQNDMVTAFSTSLNLKLLCSDYFFG